MKKLLVLVTVVGLCTSCQKEEIPLPIKQTVQVATPAPVAKVATPYYGIIIENYNPTSKIVGLYIDNKLQKLDVGSYPVGYNQKVYAKSHDYICPNVYFPKGCRTVVSVLFSDGSNFSSVKVSRLKSNGRILIVDGASGSNNSLNFIWNASNNNSSTLGVFWGGKSVRPSNDVWTQPIEIIAK